MSRMRRHDCQLREQRELMSRWAIVVMEFFHNSKVAHQPGVLLHVQTVEINNLSVSGHLEIKQRSVWACYARQRAC
jgi:hypothetical protein